MVFNWFNRQHSDAKTEVQPAEDKQAEQPATPAAESTQSGQDSAPAEEEKSEEYLTWAKAAYENIRRRQQQAAQADVKTSTETSMAAPASTLEISPADAMASAAAVSPPERLETGEATEATIVAETPTSSIAPEVLAPDQADQDLTEPESTGVPTEAELAPSPTTEETPPEDGDRAIDQSPAIPDAIAMVETPELSPAQVVDVAPSTSIEETPPVAPSPSESVLPEAVASPSAEEKPFWARAVADQDSKLERLRSTTIATVTAETLGESPVAPVVALPPQAAAVPSDESSTESPESPAEALPDLNFDEGFLWSAEVLAAQGRRAEDISIEEITWLQKLRQGLDKTRRSLVNQLKAIVGQGPLNRDAVESIEDLLLQADVGVEATDRIITLLQGKLREEVLPPDQAIAYLKQILREMLNQPHASSSASHQSPIAALAPEKGILNIWLITGVNGAGKTTTIGKLAHIAKKSGYNCLIAAADTFRAAAVQQVKVWGGRSGVEVIANPGQNTDPAAVVFDAIAAARSRETELLLVDTAGRLQNKKNLMDELSKIRRIIDKKAEGAKVRSFLVLDATLGQNGVRQAEVFQQVAQLDGVILTKLDGTAKGGIALAIVQQLGLPICFIGAGEGIEDLRPFSSYEFVEALLSG